MPFLCLSSLVYCLWICWVVAAEAKLLFQSNSLLLRNLDLRVLRKYDPKENRNKAIPGWHYEWNYDQSTLRRPCSDGIKSVEVTEVIENWCKSFIKVNYLNFQTSQSSLRLKGFQDLLSLKLKSLQQSCCLIFQEYFWMKTCPGSKININIIK